MKKCEECKQPMVVVHYQARTGRDGREIKTTYRCKACWRHETTTHKREHPGFEGKVNL